jgi:hypothetical protein
MNLGLWEKLKQAFPNTIPVERPLVKEHNINNPHQLAGFTSTEGCFQIMAIKPITHKLGMIIYLDFRLTQHERD